jgi:hypothetical protein
MSNGKDEKSTAFDLLVWVEGNVDAVMEQWPNYKMQFPGMEKDREEVLFALAKHGWRVVSRQEIPRWFGLGVPHIVWTFTREVECLMGTRVTPWTSNIRTGAR